MSVIEDQNKNRKRVLDLVEYLMRLARLRTKIIRDVQDYQDVLWLDDIPRGQKECFTRAWGPDERVEDADIWTEIRNRKEPPLPKVPTDCEGWYEQASLRNKNDIPELLPEITKLIEHPGSQEQTDNPEFISHTERLQDHPEVQNTWEKYIDERWFPWVDEHNDWEHIHKVYAKLFAIHQEQLRLGEEYELVLAFGLLIWQTNHGQRVRRHIIVANATLEFESQLAKFTVRPLPDGAKVRPELDMLDGEDQPVNAEQTARDSLAEGEDDDPWNTSVVEGVLQSLVHSIDPEGEYSSALQPKSTPSKKPVVVYAPALILRKRSVQGLTETLKRIKEKIENGGGIPTQFGSLAEIQTTGSGVSEHDPGEATSRFDGNLFFPKPWNEEQRRIAEKMRTSKGILVQGPPGTGKSHTIANLICHLLATGQRTLITAKTPRALQVLEGLVPKELHPLCISLLGGGPAERKSLESSVSGILQKDNDWQANRATRKIKNRERKLQQLREEKAEVARRLRQIRESETYPHVIAEGTYRGTAARIAETVNRDRNAYEWFTDTVLMEAPCPLTKNSLQEILDGLRRFGPATRKELGQKWPENLIPIEGFGHLVESENKAIQEHERWFGRADNYTVAALSDIAGDEVQAINDAVRDLENLLHKLSTLTHMWVEEALRDIAGGSALTWRERHRATQTAIETIEPLVSVADNRTIAFPDGIDNQTLLEISHKLKKYVARGGRLSWWTKPFQSKTVREHRQVLEGVMMNGRRCISLEQFSVLIDVLTVRHECEKAWRVWAGHHSGTSGLYALQLQELRQLHEALSQVLSLEALIDNCRTAIRRCSSLHQPRWMDESEVEHLLAACRAALAAQDTRRASEEIQNLEEPLVGLVRKANSHPITQKCLSAIRERDVDRYQHAVHQIQDLAEQLRLMQEHDVRLNRLRDLVPNLTVKMEETYDSADWDRRISDIGSAWEWAQAKFWVDEYIRNDDYSSLQERSRRIERDVSKVVAELAELHAWSFCLSRLEDSHRSRMRAWQQAMVRLGKATGKYAWRHRRDAQTHLNECREAVPAWVMPLHRVWDTVIPSPGIFDVVIIDEASQCGPEALPLLYLGKKVLIVGDDKQISPEAVGLDRSAVHRLMEQFLSDFAFKDTFAVESSLFDHGQRLYHGGHITLREHFRCMPEIIRFSNDHFYSATPLIPLRQYGTDRLAPLEHVFVEGGHREGSHQTVINKPEADAIVEKIVKLCNDKRYSDKTMGVVVLQTGAQPGLIERELLKQLGAEEMERRRLVCGNPYSFQGDERDVMFLSMVAATNERIGPYTKPADERRFNVAASRARDQMFLFHSVTVNDLSESDLRRKLLEFFVNPVTRPIAGIKREELELRAVQDDRTVLEPPAPFDSWFEVDVALALARKNFFVVPQYKVAGKRIDLVVGEGNSRLAVECDGEYHHGVDQYEKDMERQRQLERCGWEFFRVRESAFRANKETALERLWSMLEERGIVPNAKTDDQPAEPGQRKVRASESGIVKKKKSRQHTVEPLPLFDSVQSVRRIPDRGAAGLSSSEIKAAILRVLQNCPNRSCKRDSITSRVLRELRIVTRGQPRKRFERRIKQNLNVLEKRGDVESYKAKNERIRLAKGI